MQFRGTKQPAVYSTSYDPKTGDYVRPDGKIQRGSRQDAGNHYMAKQMINPTVK